MSADDEQQHPEVTYMPDLVPRVLVVGVLAWTLIIAVVLCVVAYVLLVLHERAYRPDRKFPERNLPAPHEVAHVRSSPFELPDTTPTLADDERVLLDSYGWVDRDKKIVRIPVERAVQLLLERGQP